MALTPEQITIYQTMRQRGASEQELDAMLGKWGYTRQSLMQELMGSQQPAVVHNQPAVVEKHIPPWYDPSGLSRAAEQGHADVVKVLLAGGADPKAANALGTTPLMMAAAAGNAAAITSLVENGAELEAKEKTFGQTPLMFAAANNRVEALKALVKLGANLK